MITVPAAVFAPVTVNVSSPIVRLVKLAVAPVAPTAMDGFVPLVANSKPMGAVKVIVPVGRSPPPATTIEGPVSVV